MNSKYHYVDLKLMAWIEKIKKGITVNDAYRALRISSPQIQRHVSRRFSRLMDLGVLVCETHGTSRVCRLEGTMPQTLTKPRMVSRSISHRQARSLNTSPSDSAPAIKATTSEEFLAAGGKIEVLPSPWDAKSQPPKGVGILSMDDYLASLD